MFNVNLFIFNDFFYFLKHSFQKKIIIIKSAQLLGGGGCDVEVVYLCKNLIN